MLVQLRDGRKIIGILRSFDQFANVVLEEAVERVIIDKRYADVPLGLYVIRGENVVLLGQIVRAQALGHPRIPVPCRPPFHSCATTLVVPPTRRATRLRVSTTNPLYGKSLASDIRLCPCACVRWSGRRAGGADYQHAADRGARRGHSGREA
jgi:small nuclear ribonucleoprotein (snRNP)-like protein